MLNPAEMKNKAEVITSINAAQVHFGETPSNISPAVKRPALESMLLLYVERFRSTKSTSFADIDCIACDSTGIYEDNGGACYRCKGKGYQDEADQKRNYGYDLHHPRTPTPAPAPTAELEPDPVTGEYDEDDIPF